ncbi:MAG: glycine cleavage system protein [Actinomycetota bacterium]
MAQEVPEGLRFSAEHEWVRVEGDVVVVGITAHAAEQLGDVVFVDLPPVNALLEAGRAFGEIESTKSVSDLYAPVSGRVVARNDALDTAPETVNRDPYGEGWMLRVAVSGGEVGDGLMDAPAYRALLGS